jgi:hypothetical protein
MILRNVQLIALTPNPSPDGEGLIEISKFPLLWERARVRAIGEVAHRMILEIHRGRLAIEGGCG